MSPPMTAPTTPALDQVARIIREHLDFGQPFQDRYLRAADAILALTQASAAKVPEGWKLVPIEPTLDMKDSATTVMVDTGVGGHTALNWEEAAQVWSAMLAASPSETGR